MQGLEALDQFKNFVSKIGGLGRYEDTYIVHAAEGETVVPMEVLDRNPVLKKRLFKTMMDMGIEPGRYIVGNELNSKNPITGQPEFFLKKVVDRLKKAAADISGYAAPIIGAMYGAPAGALAGGILGSFKRENPGDPTQGLNMALRGGIAGIGSNIAGGQNIFTGKGLSGDTFLTPTQLYRQYTEGDGLMANLKDFVKDESGDYRSKILQKFLGSSPEEKKIVELTDIIREGGAGKEAAEAELKKIINTNELLEKAGVGPAGSRFKEVILPYLAANLGLGFLIDQTTDNQDVGLPADTMPEGNVLEGILNPVYKASGGVMDLQDGGESVGPGTGTSDSIPAMLSDGEFVMTAKAVRGAGGGDRREGARKMYQAMDRLEAMA